MIKDLNIRETTEKLWGEPCTFTPALLDEVFGDGEKIAIFQTMNDRPYFWLVLVDSKTDFDSNEDDNGELLEEVWSALESEFGVRFENYDENGEELPEPIENNYPAVSGDSGTILGDVPENYRKELINA